MKRGRWPFCFGFDSCFIIPAITNLSNIRKITAESYAYFESQGSVLQPRWKNETTLPSYTIDDFAIDYTSGMMVREDYHKRNYPHSWSIWKTGLKPMIPHYMTNSLRKERLVSWLFFSFWLQHIFQVWRWANEPRWTAAGNPKVWICFGIRMPQFCTRPVQTPRISPTGCGKRHR